MVLDNIESNNSTSTNTSNNNNSNNSENIRNKILSLNFTEGNIQHQTNNSTNFYDKNSKNSEVINNEETDITDSDELLNNNVSLDKISNVGEQDNEQDNDEIKYGSDNENSGYEDDSDMENITESDLNNIIEEDTQDINSDNNLLSGGAKHIYNISYILDDDSKLINPDKVMKQVDKYIDNYNSEIMTKYKKLFKQTYQKYSNKNYIIKSITGNNNKSKIVVIKNDKTQKQIYELEKPHYIYYNNDGNLSKMKREISNARTELLYKYEKFAEKLIVTLDEKKQFEKHRLNFIELLETYYTYTLYHSKINNIITLNKILLILQKPIWVFKENSDDDKQILFSNVYNVDKSIIDSMNKYNSDRLTQYNNIILSLTGKSIKDIIKDKKIQESIKSYIDKKEFNKINEQLILIESDQDNYINYIIDTIPNLNK